MGKKKVSKGNRPRRQHLEKIRAMAKEDLLDVDEETYVPYLTIAQKRFLAAYSRLGIITAAVLEAKINRSSHYKWIEDSPDYRIAFVEADQESKDIILAACRKVALDEGNVPMPIHLSKGMYPEMFGTQRHELSGPNGKAIDVNQKTTTTVDQLLGKINDFVIQRQEALDTQPPKPRLLDGPNNRVSSSKGRNTKS